MGGGTIERLVGLFRGRQPVDAYVCQGCGTGFDLQYHVCPACGSFSVDADSTHATALGDD
jgi:rubrerythrin